MRVSELKNRTKAFATAIIKLAEKLPNAHIGRTISGQIIRSSTSVASNYRTTCSAKSDKDFIFKMGIVIEEADETQFWLEMIDELHLIIQDFEVKKLIQKANALVAVFVSSSKTVKKRLKN
ncbi:MAG: four helix bundle protein [Bacteroidetes bacterium]|jgi:four helix bundle protein|nr:four helix bundle protein [Bacteroidota bacterium]